MKNNLLQLLVLVLTLTTIVSVGFTFKKERPFRPPGTVKIVDNFFFDETEITNIDWKEYINYKKRFKGENSLEYQNSLPDTMVWELREGYNSPYAKTYFQHPAYNNYPVVGISHQQATDYCQWRTERVKEMMEVNEIPQPKDFFYRLPTKTEWELIANAGYSKKAKRIFYKQKKIAKKSEEKFDPNAESQTLRTFQFTHMKYHSADKKREQYFPGMLPNVVMPAPTRSYMPNKLGIFNINGNVAEMVQEKGIAKGGSFQHYYEDIVPTNKDLSYENPTRWLGFRCVCEVVEY